MTNRLFVYGTLAPGRPNEHILADVPGSGIGTASGRHYHRGAHLCTGEFNGSSFVRQLTNKYYRQQKSVGYDVNPLRGLSR